MTFVSITELRRRFSEIIASVERGEVYVITRRGIPIAKIIPAQKA